MCLTNLSKKKKAILPLIVFKEAANYTRITDLNFTAGYFPPYPPYLRFVYVKDEETPYVHVFPINKFSLEVNEGYHSFRLLLNDDIDEYFRVGIFIIPRGAYYFNGKNNGHSYGRCASSMIYVGPLSFKNYLRAIWMKITCVTTKYK